MVATASWEPHQEEGATRQSKWQEKKDGKKGAKNKWSSEKDWTGKSGSKRTREVQARTKWYVC